jgi:hypothetical protein
VPIEESDDPGSGVARRLLVETHPGQRAAEQADDREHPGSAASFTRRARECGQLAGMVVHEGVTDARVELHVIVDAVAVQDPLQRLRELKPGNDIPIRPGHPQLA